MPRYKKHPLYPEPGAGVLTTWKGLPELKPPEPLPKGKLTAAEIQERIAYEGLGFCVWSFIPSGKIEDAKLAKMWEECGASMAAIIEYLERRKPRKKKKLWQSKTIEAVTDTEEL